MRRIKKIINERLQFINRYLNALIGDEKLGYEKHIEKTKEFIIAEQDWLNLKSFVERGVENHPFRYIEGKRKIIEVLQEIVDRTIKGLLYFNKQELRKLMESGLLSEEIRIKFECDIIELEGGLFDIEREWGEYLNCRDEQQ